LFGKISTLDSILFIETIFSTLDNRGVYSINDEKNRPRDIAIIVVRMYKDRVLIPSLVRETSSVREIMPQTIEKKINGIIINFKAEINKSDITFKIFEIINSVMRES